MDPITLADYHKYDGEFWEKFYYVREKLGHDKDPDQVLAVMETLGGVVLTKREEEDKDSYAPMGFNKPAKEKTNDETVQEG